MIQLLVALIEWFAVTGLSALGISYEPPRPCINPEPAEVRQTVNWVPADARAPVQVIHVSNGDCIVGIDTLVHGSTPYFLTPSDRYDS
tara:strand:- start:27236 stop:27499 length:264 start_codon:yes stop_codon:yes gene_type:complete